ncbi:F-box/RNI-like/FBD-like domains-containing protein [Striga asiatica]|uniref:F-box/RNI-like/FBD-like domains-containing protein n=1 Tax=Striga asiatica TaxID=4170 RepID=A0A5A7PVU7_STRAF|nr:F-box/RNI-like/FBD-like domains-containing protein [Striga asiatica]
MDMINQSSALGNEIVYHSNSKMEMIYLFSSEKGLQEVQEDNEINSKMEMINLFSNEKGLQEFSFSSCSNQNNLASTFRKTVYMDMMNQKGLQKCVKRYHGDNLISRLPDDILLAILSFLPLKEVGRTSVLSSRWKNLWSYISHLNFDDYSSMEKIMRASEFHTVSVEREKYVKWVDSVLQSHRGSTVKELRICFSLVKSATNSITKWLEFAFERHTEKLELNLSEGDLIHAQDKTYVFPQELCSSDGPYKSSRLFNCKSIKMLSLGCIQVSGETIEFFLRGCPLLEQLNVRASKYLTRLEVCGPSLVLKHLEIWDCTYLKSLRISAPKLSSLRLDKIEGLLLEDVPMLASVYVTYADSLIPSIYVERLISTLLCRLSQLEILTFDIYCRKELLLMLKFPLMPKLKKLVIIEGLRGVDSSLLGLANFITASPNLQEFELKQRWHKVERSNNEIQKELKHSPLHQHLNVFRFLGYYGCPSDVELVNYLLENCVALKEIIVDTQTQLRLAYDPLDSEQLELAEIAKGHAKQ